MCRALYSFTAVLRRMPKFCFSSNSQRFCSSKANDGVRSILKLKHFVKPCGTLKVALPYAVQIVTCDPNANPSMDKIEVEVNGLSSLEDNDIQQMCRIEKNSDSITVTCPDDLKFEKHQISCRINVPIKYNLDVAMKDHGDAYLQSIECNHCVVSTQQGSIILSKMKTENLEANTAGGHILCKGTVLGDIRLDTRKDGSIQADKLQGKTIKVQTEKGSVSIRSLYAENSQISNLSNGTIHLSNVHGNTNLLMKAGNAHVQGVDGNLNVLAENADISVHISQLNCVSIESCGGSVDVSLPENASAKVHLEGAEVNVSDDLNFVGETGPLLKQWTGKVGTSGDGKSQVYVVSQEGFISLKTLDWLSSLNLFKTDPEKI